MFIDTVRNKDVLCQMHLLREELTQALGMMKDHTGPSDSIFYSDWTCSIKYSELDKRMIQYFLMDEIKAGMDEDSFRMALNNL